MTKKFKVLMKGLSQTDDKGRRKECKVGSTIELSPAAEDFYVREGYVEEVSRIPSLARYEPDDTEKEKSE